MVTAAHRFQPGENNPKWRGGRTVTKDGYVRYTAGDFRNRYEHRVIMEFVIGCPIPRGFEVHHIDRDRSHNCPENLMLLAAPIHEALHAGFVC
jgi:hypothetical protein